MTSRRRPNVRRALALALAALAALCAQPAGANPYELFGFTPRSIGLASANVALGDDLAGSFYNPAGMLGHTKSEFGLGIDYTRMMLHIDRTSGGSPVRDGYTDDAPRVELAIIFPLGGAILKDRVVIGLNLGHPVGALIRVQTLDQSRPQFYMYQSKPQRFATSGSIGIKIINGLSIGIGAQVIAEQIGKVNFQIDLAAKKFVSREISIDLNTVPEPLAGILIEPNDWLKIGLSWRKEAQLYYEQPTDLNLGDIGDLQLNVHGIAQYWPHVFSLGVVVKPTRRWLISAQADYLLWNRAPLDQVFCPFRTQWPSFFSALARRLARSLPASGSLKPWQKMSSPLRIFSTYCSFCHGVPCATKVGARRLTPRRPRMPGAPDLAISSA